MTQSRWRLVYDAIAKLEVDGTISYLDLVRLTDLDIAASRPYLYRAVRELEIQQQRTMECVRTIGYRVVAANEHERLVRRDIKSIHRKSKRAYSKTVNVRRDELTPEERRRIDDQQLKLAQHEEMLKRLDSRTNRLEAQAKQDRRVTKEVTAEMSDRITRLEQQIADLTFQEPNFG